MLDRNERRRRLAVDKAAFTRGLDVNVRDGRQIGALMRVLHDLVRISVARQSVSPLMEWLHANYSAASRQFASAVQIDCRAGCAHCCHMWVDASPPEVIFMAKSLAGSARKTAAASVSEAMSATGKLSFDERAAFVFPCPMLRSGQCSAYAVRPIVCRGAVSADVRACARVYNLESDEKIPVPMPYMAVSHGYRLALAGAVKQAGLA